MLWMVCIITAVISSVCIKLSKEVHYLRSQNILLKGKMEKAEENAELLKNYEVVFDSIERSHPTVAAKYNLFVSNITPTSHR